mmetsp:Transcript_136732/g.237436  ORF Transcript_136732/g.237436 Transcript_136732/m.237436 type:complete len:81 (-) Transcript_136732:486-728(-)
MYGHTAYTLANQSTFADKHLSISNWQTQTMSHLSNHEGPCWSTMSLWSVMIVMDFNDPKRRGSRGSGLLCEEREVGKFCK